MKYVLLCCHDEKTVDSMSKSEYDAVMEETIAYCEALKKSGHLVTDGPFAETKEQLGGFFLISARDLNEAIQVASKFPSVRFGTMEVRPVRDFPSIGRPASSS